VSTRINFGCLVVLLTTMPALPAAASPAKGREADSNIRLNVELVMVPVTVTDRRGATVLGLERDNFKLFEDKIAQTIVSFSGQDEPCSVGLIFDVSGSMRDKLPAAKEATRAFFRTSNPKDEAFLVTISTQPEVHTGFTEDAGTIENRVQSAHSGGRTAFIDSVYLALTRMREAHNARKALVIISDGMDNHSRYSKRELMALALEADVQIYTISLNDVPRHKKPIEMQEERRGLWLLDDLATKTGGLNFTIVEMDQAAKVAGKIGTALRNQYVLGYRPPENGQTGKWRKIQVKANVPGVHLYSRTGYYAP
jgi:Ca-activated chloride channel family protein